MHIEMTQTYSDWENNLKDWEVRARIQARIERLALGNPGQHRVLSGGVSELKLDFGAGYRVYYTQRGKTLIVLLAGGDKSSQSADIKIAISLAKNL
jgi:putative addiction module killer protein